MFIHWSLFGVMVGLLAPTGSSTTIKIRESTTHSFIDDAMLHNGTDDNVKPSIPKTKKGFADSKGTSSADGSSLAARSERGNPGFTGLEFGPQRENFELDDLINGTIARSVNPIHLCLIESSQAYLRTWHCSVSDVGNFSSGLSQEVKDCYSLAQEHAIIQRNATTAAESHEKERSVGGDNSDHGQNSVLANIKLYRVSDKEKCFASFPIVQMCLHVFFQPYSNLPVEPFVCNVPWSLFTHTPFVDSKVIEHCGLSPFKPPNGVTGYIYTNDEDCRQLPFQIKRKIVQNQEILQTPPKAQEFFTPVYFPGCVLNYDLTLKHFVTVPCGVQSVLMNGFTVPLHNCLIQQNTISFHPFIPAASCLKPSVKGACIMEKITASTIVKTTNYVFHSCLNPYFQNTSLSIKPWSENMINICKHVLRGEDASTFSFYEIDANGFATEGEGKCLDVAHKGIELGKYTYGTIQWSTMIATISIGCFGTISGLVAIIALLTGYERRFSRSVYFVFVIAADLILLIATCMELVPYLSSDFSINYLQPKISSSDYCRIMQIFQNVANDCSFLGLLALTIERYIAVAKPLFVASWCTKRRASLICLAIFVALLTFRTSYTISVELPMDTTKEVLWLGQAGSITKSVLLFCSYNLTSNVGMAVTAISVAIFRVIPWIAIAIINILIYNKYKENLISTQDSIASEGKDKGKALMSQTGIKDKKDEMNVKVSKALIMFTIVTFMLYVVPYSASLMITLVAKFARLGDLYSVNEMSNLVVHLCTILKATVVSTLVSIASLRARK